MAIVDGVNARAWFAFLTVSLLWGIPYLFIKVAVDDGIPPAFLAWIRVTIAAAILLLLSWRLGLLSGLRGRWRVLALYATVEIAIPFPLIGFGEQRVSSSLAAILIASVPLIIALIALRFDHEERASGSRLVGLFVGFAGVVALVGIDVAGNSRELVGAIAVLVAAVGYAIGPMLIKADLAEVDPRAMMAGALGLAAVILTPAAIAAPPDVTLTAEAIAAIIVLSVLCTAVAFVVFADADRRGRSEPRLGDHLRRPRCRGRARRRPARRATRCRRDRRVAPDPRRLMARDRRQAPLRPRRRDHSPEDREAAAGPLD